MLFKHGLKVIKKAMQFYASLLRIIELGDFIEHHASSFLEQVQAMQVLALQYHTTPRTP